MENPWKKLKIWVMAGRSTNLKAIGKINIIMSNGNGPSTIILNMQFVFQTTTWSQRLWLEHVSSTIISYLEQNQTNLFSFFLNQLNSTIYAYRYTESPIEAYGLRVFLYDLRTLRGDGTIDASVPVLQ